MRKLKNEALGRLTPEAAKIGEKNNFSVVLDDIRSMHNVGSAFRTADAFAAAHMYLTGITAQPPHREINKTALGATESVPWSYDQDAIALVKKLKDRGTYLVSVEQAEQSTTLSDFFPDPKFSYAYVCGNEVFGVKQEIVDISDMVLEIPQFGSKHSLNISVSLGVVLWDHLSKNVGRKPLNLK